MKDNRLNEAGFVSKFSSSEFLSTVSNAVKNLASLGMRYSDMVVKNSKAIGVTEAAFKMNGPVPTNVAYSLAMADTGPKKYITYFDKEYKAQRETLRKFAQNGEIEFILETITDESIVYDMKNFFCQVDTANIEGLLKKDIKEDYIKNINSIFKTLYVYFGFNNDISAWQYFKQFLIDGVLAFEIIYNDNCTNIIGFKELDPISLMPDIEPAGDGKNKRIWWQYKENPALSRKLYDSQIIYISFAKGSFKNRVSYTQRLTRSFNLLRIMENTRVIWNLMNSTYRLKMIVPIGNKSPQKAKESLAELMSIYKEEINLDYDTGELKINGRPTVGQFYKNYLFGSKNGESVNIETMSADGPDLSDTDALKYFYDKLKMDSKIPFSRFDRDSSGGQVYLSAEGIDREEVRFMKFINRLRSIFQEILLKPLWIQLTLKYPELADDELFKANLGIKYTKDNIFEQQREKEMIQKQAELIMTLKDIMTDDGEKPFFSTEWLVMKYLGLTYDEFKENVAYKEAKKADGDDAKNADKATDAFSDY